MFKMSQLCCPGRYLIALSLMLTSNAVCAQRPQGSLLDKGKVEDFGCPEGWFPSHGYCLLPTSLPAEEARAFCEKKGALSAFRVCISRASGESRETTYSEETATTGTSGEQTLGCPSGWTSYLGFCLLWSSDPARMCSLLGAQNVLGTCIMNPGRVQVPAEFLNAIKRLDGGSDYEMTRSSRMCCCAGGFCK